jgi:hypothetical protein
VLLLGRFVSPLRIALGSGADAVAPLLADGALGAMAAAGVGDAARGVVAAGGVVPGVVVVVAVVVTAAAAGVITLDPVTLLAEESSSQPVIKDTSEHNIKAASNLRNSNLI